MGRLPRFLSCATIALLLACCAQSETRSIVSSEDIPAGKYKKIVLFIENLEEPERTTAEQIIVATLQNASINVLGSSQVFSKGARLTPNAQAQRIRKEGFDAALFVNVEQKGVSEQQVENAYFDGQMIQFNMGLITVGHNLTDLYVVKPDGSVYQPMLVLKTKSELQDVKSGKQVWAAETIASGHATTTNMDSVFAQASKQIVEQMRTDQAI